MKNKNYAIILTLVAILAVLVLVLNETDVLSGAVVLHRRPLLESEYQDGCVDTDPSNYFDIQGFVKHKAYIYNDYCSNGRVFQVYCASSKVVRMTKGYKCPNGCQNGACI